MATKGIYLGMSAGLLLFAAPARAAAPELLLGNGALPAEKLPAGEDLWVELRGADPGAGYEFQLFAAAGDQLAKAPATADAAGNVGKTLLWPAGGVVGCDCGAAADPHRHRFATFEEAEGTLDGEELLVVVLDAAGQEVAQAALPVTRTAGERAYFSDEEGCPRRRFEPGEKIHLSFLHPDRDRPKRLFFLAAAGGWPLGKEIEDLRGAPEPLELPGEEEERVTLELDLGGALSEPGDYSGIVRHAEASPPRPIREIADAVVLEIDPRAPNGGIMVTLDTCANTGPPDPNGN